MRGDPLAAKPGAEPWDRPAWPKRGNCSVNVLYESIGRALNFWEFLEVTLAHLYAGLCEQSLFDNAANQAYGRSLNFSTRLAKMRAAGERYFQKRPHQSLEGEFSWALRYAEGYSHRRNDIAHGLVRLIDMVFDPRAGLLSGEPSRWCLVPPDFREDKFIAPNMPAYVLTSREINQLRDAFIKIQGRTWALALAVELPQHALRRRRAVPHP